MNNRGRSLGQRLSVLAMVLLVGAEHAFRQPPWQSICRYAGLAVLLCALALLIMAHWGRGKPESTKPGSFHP